MKHHSYRHLLPCIAPVVLWHRLQSYRYPEKQCLTQYDPPPDPKTAVLGFRRPRRTTRSGPIPAPGTLRRLKLWLELVLGALVRRMGFQHELVLNMWGGGKQGIARGRVVEVETSTARPSASVPSPELCSVWETHIPV